MNGVAAEKHGTYISYVRAVQVYCDNPSNKQGVNGQQWS